MGTEMDAIPWRLAVKLGCLKDGASDESGWVSEGARESLLPSRVKFGIAGLCYRCRQSKERGKAFSSRKLSPRRAAGQVQRGSRSCGPSFSFLTKKSGAGQPAAWGQSLPLAPSDSELSRRRATSRSSNCEAMSRTLSCPHVFLPVDEDQHDDGGWCLQETQRENSPFRSRLLLYFYDVVCCVRRLCFILTFTKSVRHDLGLFSQRSYALCVRNHRLCRLEGCTVLLRQQGYVEEMS
ncbi:uncharacterized protein VSU04_008194 [Chlamydotis macqueenii]